ncbi:MAG: hypothetical protein ABL921_18650 [Pirellula sp.]
MARNHYAFLASIAILALVSNSNAIQGRVGAATLPPNLPPNQIAPNHIDSAGAVQGAKLIANQVSAQEWLGPLSAIALSPFFGLACLSGAATYGPDWLQSRSVLLGPSSPLNSPLLFWCMLGLTIATSLPRFTKVSKPLAMAAEKLEAYSAVIILLAMKFLYSPAELGQPGIADASQMVMVAGIASVPMDVLLSICAAINIVVVNTIKLAIELLVWLIPIPTVDAFLEVANKSICAGLMAIYAYSPMLATLLNLIIFGCCCLVFFKVKRHMVYVMELYLMPVVERIFSMQRRSDQFLGFLADSWNGFPKKTMLRVSATNASDSACELESLGWMKRQKFSGDWMQSENVSGLLNDQIRVRIGSAIVVLDVRKGVPGSLGSLAVNASPLT